jgi:probable HAF family extracellular repeat protein
VDTYTITELPPPAGAPPYSQALALNSNGSAAGWGLLYQAVLWDGGTPALLENQPPTSMAQGMNDSDDVVGVFDVDAVYPVPSFLYTKQANQFNLLTSVLGENAWATDINNAGFVVGQAGPFDAARPFIYDSKGSGSVTLLDPLPTHAQAWANAINEAGHVVGNSVNDQGEDEHVFLFRNDHVEDLGEAPWALGINSSDVICGAKIFPSNATHTAFRLDASVRGPSFEDLGHSPVSGYDGSVANGINDDGVVVGYSFAYPENLTPLPARAFVHFPPSSWHDLEDLVPNAAGWQLGYAQAINNLGQIAGWGTFQGNMRGFLLTPMVDVTSLPKFEKYAYEFIMLFGGAERGGPGVGILPSGKPIPIPPHEWKRLSPAKRDILLGLAVRNLASVIEDPQRRDLLRKAGQDLVEATIRQLEGEHSD